MSQSSIRTILDDLRAKNDPEKTAIANALSKYLGTNDPAAVSLLIPFNNHYHLWELAKVVSGGEDPDSSSILDFLVLAMTSSSAEFPVIRSNYDYPAHTIQSPAEDYVAAFLHSFDPFTSSESASLVQRLLDAAERFGVSRLRLAACLMAGASWRYRFGWTKSDDSLRYFGCAANVNYSRDHPPTTDAEINPFDRTVWDMSDSEMLDFLLLQVKAPVTRSLLFSRRFGRFHGALAVIKPHIIEQFLTQATPEQVHTLNWTEIVRSTGHFDQQAIAFAKVTSGDEALRLLVLMAHLRAGTCTSETFDRVFDPQFMPDESGISYLRDHHPERLPAYFTSCLADPVKLLRITIHALQTSFQTLIQHWDEGGRDFAFALAKAPLISSNYYPDGKLSLQGLLLRGLLETSPHAHTQDLREIFAVMLELIERTPLNHKDRLETLRYLYIPIIEHHPELFREELWSLLQDKSKVLRDLSIPCLANFPSKQSLPRALDLLRSNKSDIRASAADLLGIIANSSALSPLLSALEAETSDPVRTALHQAIKQCGGSTPQEAFNLPAFLSGHVKGLKPPSCTWLTFAKLPPLHATDGTLLPEQAIVFLIAKQSKQKEIVAATDVAPLLDYIDREKSAPFAAALVEGFLNSQQAAADRWALTLGGLLGDNRIINLLLPRIQGWCENARCKLAEYAAQAISLLPGNEPLMVLDTLANRYRTKFKNIGRACSEAFNAAATARGITADELGDMVVPDFGFDAEGVRRFDWEGGGISAELGADFKLTWFDPETEKSWKTIPAGAPDETKAEVKTVTKLIRETVKAQTARLEMSLVRQRRWPVARWRELYEEHPLLRSFASGLVWGVYDVSGNLLRTFRRYPNGILADAAGAMEELTETDANIGMVHPLELDQPAIDLWRAHLQRMKVKQPFSQIDRPVELMDPLHGNRREISLTKDRKLSAGTFRSRAEKRGWTRGSVIDAGGIASYYKLYPGAGVEVNLPLDGFYIGCDPMDAIELSAAYFVTAGTVERGSYMYDDPAPDDPRVLRFDKVPPVVFSETISDLKAIIATKEQ